ncbi:hypothetical protein [Actinoplanes flavus]|uniref:Transposase (putative) YhgA-like domain-containing protein n=1 Tax=Actinoplanes flavus TaxID=2820290 RepID=A0ABS3UF21_9ACTN|nr:hypothetical protein [Actinoplanes flavus]MBO3736292.1 hypothetical protein [Actinoplanes flavus]
MPSHLHEILIEMFRGRPSLAAELLDGPLHGDLPEYDEAHLSSAELTDVAPTEYRADAVITLTRSGDIVLAVVVEVQRRADAQKRRSWPAYVATLYARLGCPVALLVLCPQQSVADWAMRDIRLGPPGSQVTPVVFGPAQTPLITDPATARQMPELAVLSTLAHAGEADPTPLFKALFSALDVIEADRAALYHDFMLTALPAATRKLLEEFMTTTDHPYKSDWARRQFAEGEATAILTVLAARGLEISDEARTTITGCTDLDQLTEWIRRAATAERVEDLGLESR